MHLFVQVVWLSRLQETQAKYKDAIKRSECAAYAAHGGTANNGENSNHVGSTNGCGAPPSNENEVDATRHMQTASASATPAADVALPTRPAEGTTGRPDRPGRLTSHRVLGPATSLNSAFWSSTSSDHRSTTSSSQSIAASTSRGSMSNCPPSLLIQPSTPTRSAVSRTVSAGPCSSRSTMSGIAEESPLYQYTTYESRYRNAKVKVVSKTFVGSRRGVNCQSSTSSVGVTMTSTAMSRSCPCLARARSIDDSPEQSPMSPNVRDTGPTGLTGAPSWYRL